MENCNEIKVVHFRQPNFQNRKFKGELIATLAFTEIKGMYYYGLSIVSPADKQHNINTRNGRNKAIGRLNKLLSRDLTAPFGILFKGSIWINNLDSPSYKRVKIFEERQLDKFGNIEEDRLRFVIKDIKEFLFNLKERI